MKKLWIFVLLIMFVPIVANAQDYNVNTLIPVDQVGTVATEKFTYNGIIYHSQANEKGNCLLSFDSIQNNTLSKVAVSINVLLFDESEKNIGFLTYCSDKDISSNYSGFKLAGNQASAFSINVNSKYFVEGKNPSNVRFIAVMNENKYCQIGGYTKYKGLTMEEITKGDVSSNDSKISSLGIFEVFQNKGLMMLIIIVLSVIGGFIIYGMILNSLHRGMYGRGNGLVYLPIANNYFAVKMAFGKIVAIVTLVANFLSGVLALLNLSFVLYLVSFVQIVAFIVDIIKLVTKKYDLFYLEPAISGIDYGNNNGFVREENNSSSDNESQQTLDLSYNNVDVNNLDSKEEVEEPSNDILEEVSNHDISIGGGSLDEELPDDSSSEDSSYDDELNRMLGNPSNSSDDGGESDLSKFFH